jgi:hypothetical protein
MIIKLDLSQKCNASLIFKKQLFTIIIHDQNTISLSQKIQKNILMKFHRVVIKHTNSQKTHNNKKEIPQTVKHIYEKSKIT